MIRAFVMGVTLMAVSQAIGQTSATDWSRLPPILARIVPPSFPSNDFVLTSYGGVGDGVTDCTSAFSNAIAACSGAGGGRVVVTGGTYLTGAIHLLNNVNLFVASNSTILFSTNPAAYLPVVFTRIEGIEAMNYSPFIYAFEQTNIAVTGGGTLNGQSTWTTGPWVTWAQSGDEGTDDTILEDMATTNLPVAQRVFGAGYYLRPVFVQPFRCVNVLIQGVTVMNSPMWTLNPVYCTNVTISNVAVNTTINNTDGCDPDSCTDVLIKKCRFNTGDDCSSVKAGRDTDGLRVNIPSQNIVYQNCLFTTGHGGVATGSETSGGVTNVFVENCQFNSVNLEIALRFKTCPQRGGFIENVYARNCSIENAQTGISAIMNYCTTGTNTPILRNIDIRDCFFETLSGSALVISGYNQTLQVTNFTVANCRFVNTGAANSINDGIVTSINNRGGGL